MHSFLNKVMEPEANQITTTRAKKEVAGSLSLESSPHLQIHEKDYVAPSMLFDAVAREDVDQVASLLATRNDPNDSCKEFVYNETHFIPCTLLPVAVMSGRVDIVRLLVHYQADLSSEYGFLAGCLQIPWSAPAIFATVEQGDLVMLKELVKLQADPHEVSSANSNLVWQCAQLGQTDMLKHLVSLGVSCNTYGESQDIDGVSYSALHIAAHHGHLSIIEELLDARAEINTINELNLTPLDEAISHCKVAAVRFLVSQGASLMQMTQVKQWAWLTSLDGDMASPSDLPQDVCRSLELLFCMGNPVLTAAAADGLRYQEEQVKELSTADVTTFLTTSTESAHKILEALFYSRDITYWGLRGKGHDSRVVRVHLTTAHMYQPRILPNGQCIQAMNVVCSECKYVELRAKALERHRLKTEHEEFLAQLAPQVGKDGMQMTSILLLECLVHNLHRDLGIYRAIANLEIEHFVHKPCQAVIQYGWHKAWRIAILELTCHVMLLMNFLFVGFLYRNYDPPKRGRYIRVIAFGGIVVWIVDVLREAFRMASYALQEWLFESCHDIRSFGPLFRIMLDGGVLMSLFNMAEEFGDEDNAIFLCAWAVCVFIKWMHITQCLSPFLFFGLHILPIWKSISMAVPYYIVLHLPVFSLMHGYYVLNTPGSSMFEFSVWESRMELYRWSASMFFVFVCIVVFASCFNAYVAAQISSFNNATRKIDLEFQKRRAAHVFKNMAVREGFKRFFDSSELAAESRRSLWFCCASED